MIAVVGSQITLDLKLTNIRYCLKLSQNIEKDINAKITQIYWFGYHVIRDHPSDNPNKYLNADTYTKFIGANFLNHNTLSCDEIELVNTCVNTYMKTGKKIEV